MMRALKPIYVSLNLNMLWMNTVSSFKVQVLLEPSSWANVCKADLGSNTNIQFKYKYAGFFKFQIQYNFNPQCFISLPHAKFPIPLKPSFNMLISHPALHRPSVFTPFPASLVNCSWGIRPVIALGLKGDNYR